MAPFRILHMIGSLNNGGSQAMVLNLYRAMDRGKVQFDFILDHPGERALADQVEAMGAKIYTIPTFTGNNVTQIRQAWDIFFQEHPEYKVLHSHVRSYASIYLPIAKKHGVKTIIHSHSTSNGKGIKALIKTVMQYPLRYQADYLIACSTKAGQWLFGKEACQKENYLFLPNAIDTEMYRYSEEVARQYRESLGLQGKFVIGHVGRFHEAKNHFFLLDVFAGICTKCPDAMLLLVGDGVLRGDIEKKIGKLGLKDRVVLTGNRNDVPQLMQAMDIFAFPSAWEGLPVTVIEAQAAGLTCLISDQITTDVDISELVVRLPIHDPGVWIDKIQNVDKKRKDVIPKIKQAGFDVNDTARQLTAFYTTIGGTNG